MPIDQLANPFDLSTPLLLRLRPRLRPDLSQTIDPKSTGHHT